MKVTKHCELVNEDRIMPLDIGYNSKYVDLATEEQEIDGVLVTVTKPTIVDPLKFNEGLKCTDFKLENLIRTGNVDTLQYSRLLQNNINTDETELEKLTEKFENYVAKENEN